MLRIGQVESSATADGKYTDGSVAGGIAATRLRAAAFNAIQEELANIVESAGMSLDPDDMTQVLAALKKQFLSRSNPFSDIKADGAAAVASALANLGLGDANGYVGRKIAEKWITASGTYTPTPGTKRIRVTIIGGGGGGGSGQGNSAGYVSAGSGGGAGGVARKTIDVTSVSSVSVTIGSGGNPGVFSSNQPGDGGTTSFGSYMTAGGGGRGSNCGSVAFGVTQIIANGGGGVGSGGDINTIGGSGGPAIILGQGYTSGGGGNSIVAGGGQPITTTASVSGINGSYGSGGSGAYILASGSEKNGGRGGAGVCIVEEFA
ncbi:carbohydrate kinase [Kluyvera ascorbata]|uniref:glycine-rich domain-containing protein n=1 Tax=Kluyvera ascorbata TaxID=51288 RepID=UPI00350EB001